MIRNWLRRWLGFTDLWNRQVAWENDTAARIINLNSRAELLEERNHLAWERIVELEKMNPSAVMTEVHQLREMIQDPHRTPVVAKTMRQYRALMEQE